MLPLFTAKELVNRDSKVSKCPSLTVRIFVQTERLFSKSQLIIIIGDFCTVHVRGR